MNPNRIVRVILGLLALALFCAYTYLHVSVTPRSRDLKDYGQPSGTITAAETTPEPEEAAEPEVPAESEDAEPAEAAEPEATPEPTVDPDSPYGKALANAAAKGLPAPPEIDVDEWQYVLVNGDHSIGEYVPENLVYLNMTGDDTEITGFDKNRQVVDARIAQPLIDMTQACKAAGLTIYLSSGYRDYYAQQKNFERVCKNNGITDGKDANGHYITMPAGCSEHQTALCCDITDRYYEIKNDSIAQVPTVQWLAEHCAEYGFILRFPADKTDVTGVMGESWHFRYVGPEAASYIMENGLCLEEFLALYGVE